MFWKNWSWPARILCGASLGLLAVLILLPVFGRARESDGPPGCSSHLKQIAVGFMMYTADYNGKLPPVSTGGAAYGWADALQPYLKSTQIYQCPQEPTEGQPNPRKSGYTDYPFNARLSGKLTAKIPDATRQILSLDGNNGDEQNDARYSFYQIPTRWRQNETSPLYRHNGLANYLFADGHVKSYLPSQVEDAIRPVF